MALGCSIFIIIGTFFMDIAWGGHIAAAVVGGVLGANSSFCAG